MSQDLLRARELLRLRRPREAGEAALRHLAATPEDPDGHAVLALTRLALDDHAGARAAAAHAIALDGAQAYLHFVLGTVALHGDDLATAQAAATAALQQDPEHAPSHALLAQTHVLRGDPRAACAAIERALRIDPDDGEHHLLHAVALQTAGDRAGALAAVHAGLSRSPDEAQLHRLHGELLLTGGAPDRAGEAFLAALRRAPDDEQARRGLLEVLRARHHAYRPVLRLRAGAMQLLRQHRWGTLALGYLACAVLVALVAGADAVKVVRAAVIATLLLPKEIANSLLLLHPFGRHVLQRREKAFALVTCTLLMVAAALGATCWLGGAPSLRRAALVCGGAALFAAVLHFAIDHSRMRRTTWVLIAVLAALVGAMLAVGAFA